MTAPAYSFLQNLRYLAMIYFRPRALIESYAREKSLLYGIVPFALKVLLIDEPLYFLAYLDDARPVSPLPKVLPIPDAQYYLWVTALSPILNIMDVLLFAGLMVIAARMPGLSRISPGKVTSFFLCAGAGLGLPAVLVDQLYQRWPQPGLTWVHPLVGMVSIAYLAGFLRCQAGLSWQRAAPLAFSTVLTFLLFRIILFR